MKTEASVAGVELLGPDDPQFQAAIEALRGREVDDVLRPALPWSVIARNNAARAVALLGVRFDMQNAAGKVYSVVHYADSLRFPENAELKPGGLRFVCAEPLYTRLVLHHEDKVDPRGPMNLANLSKALSVRASIDCVAFDDGHFSGPDSLGAFDRLAHEREAEQEFIDRVLASASPEQPLKEAMGQPGMRALARALYEEFIVGGIEELRNLARRHRLRIPLWR